jgi:hypothetical protein
MSHDDGESASEGFGKAITSVIHSPRNLSRFRMQSEKELISQQVREARKLEELIERQAENAKARRLHNDYGACFAPCSLRLRAAL